MVQSRILIDEDTWRNSDSPHGFGMQIICEDYEIKNPHKPQDFLKTPVKRMGGVGQSIRGSTAL